MASSRTVASYVPVVGSGARRKHPLEYSGIQGMGEAQHVMPGHPTSRNREFECGVRLTRGVEPQPHFGFPE